MSSSSSWVQHHQDATKIQGRYFNNHANITSWWILLIMQNAIWPFYNTLRLRQNGCHFADAIFNCIFWNENVWISINISLKFVPKGQINNIASLVQILAWRWPGDKPLSEPMMVSLLMYICFTRPQWVNSRSCQVINIIKQKINNMLTNITLDCPATLMGRSHTSQQTSLQWHHMSKHQQLDCLLKCLFKLFFSLFRIIKQLQ